MRQLATFRGLAILGTVIGHAPQWGIAAIWFWGHRCGKIEADPYLNWVGSAGYYGLLALVQLSLFVVPLFALLSGNSSDLSKRRCW